MLCTVITHLSQVDVHSVLEELGGLPGPLLDGQHPDRLHAGLQLDHSGILVLEEIRRKRSRGGGGGGGGGGAGRDSALLINE